MFFIKRDFDDFVYQALEKLKKKQNVFTKKLNINSYDSWHYDEPSGVFSLISGAEEIFFNFQMIGTFSEKSKTWLWSWANSHTYPNVSKGSLKIKKFGIRNKYDKLINAKWPAEEVDSWEMLAIASWILNPLGVYRVNTDGLHLFFVFTNRLTSQQAKERMDDSKQLVDCDCHGLKRIAFVCVHLNDVTRQGFNEAFETKENMDLEEDQDLQAWCDECEQIRLKHDGWNEESEKLTDIKLICEDCYFELKRINK